MSPDDPNAELDPSDPNPVRHLGLVKASPPTRLDEPDLNSESGAAPARVMRLRQDQDIDDANHRLYDESGWPLNGAPTFNCEGSLAAEPPQRRVADVDELGEPEGSGATASLRLMVVPSEAEAEAKALRYLELMLGQLIDHSYSDNLNALSSAEADRDTVMGTLPERVFTVKVGSHTLITDHPNVMRLLAPWLELHRTTAADLPECAHRINVALTLTPAHRLG
jgi:hypothetical protein